MSILHSFQFSIAEARFRSPLSSEPMAPPHKHKQALVSKREASMMQSIMDLSDSESSTDDDIPNVAHHKNLDAATRRNQPTVEDDISDRDELGSDYTHVRRKRGRPRKSLTIKARKINTPRARKPSKILESLQKSAELLKPIGNAEDVEMWLQDNGFEGSEHIKDLKQSCEAICEHLRSQNPTSRENSKLSGKGFNEFFVYRDGVKNVTLLAPIHLPFKANSSNYAVKKTFGFVRRKGSCLIKMHAISGYKECLEPQDDLLDSAAWLKVVRRFGRHIGFLFRSDGFDKMHGMESGDSCASHVEPSLMLYWALYILGRSLKLGKVPSIKQLFTLRKLNTPKDAEIFISDEPCDSCDSFREKMQLLTGIKFIVHVVPNLGKLELKRDPKNGIRSWQIDYNAYTQPEKVQVSRSGIQIILPSRPAIETPISYITESPEPEAELEVSTEIVATRERKHKHKHKHSAIARISSYARVETQHRTGYDDDDDDDNASVYIPDDRIRTYAGMTPTKKSTRSSSAGISTPVQEEFGFRDLDRANSLLRKEKKRQREQEEATNSYPSPLSVKKPKYTSRPEVKTDGKGSVELLHVGTALAMVLASKLHVTPVFILLIGAGLQIISTTIMTMIPIRKGDGKYFCEILLSLGLGTNTGVTLRRILYFGKTERIKLLCHQSAYLYASAPALRLVTVIGFGRCALDEYTWIKHEACDGAIVVLNFCFYYSQPQPFFFNIVQIFAIMPAHKYLSKVPEFPSDVGVANIPTVSFNGLKNGSGQESKKVYEACRKLGFFLLDLRNSEEGERLLKDAEIILDISSETLNLEPEVLQKFAYNPPKDLTGYKSAGKLKTEDGKFDATEMYTLGQDDILGTCAPRQNPAPIEANRKHCQDFFRHAYGAVCEILAHLDKQLALDGGTLSSLCSLEKPSDTSLRMLLSHPQLGPRVTLGGHTDIGTITMLFNVAGGLQILPAGSENIDSNWRYIRPELGCAVINVGDTLVEWTGGILRSSLHRVVTAPGKQASATRQSLAYLVRPNRNGSMSRLKSRVIPPLSEGEEGGTRSVNEWAAWRVQQIINGQLKPQTTGGIPLETTARTN
ncbi:hypothetical protein G7Y89_g103 [Cudoniella acicularis]|uniref:Fe2OG dioxygenase domain-containing protein n=1 Tax=Cudoniella acicularis TaxID=354080 RepID=A0A8H4RXR9_9HELO|nr:hypothetical protein G7Y89_g103 [Cudoniella acicularis]